VTSVITEICEVTVVGVDCATDPKKVGLSMGVWGPARHSISQAQRRASWPDIESQIAKWVSGPTLLAIDAPLGWPAALGQALAPHRAGERISTAPDEMFRRETDRSVQRIVGKTPMDVGADKIARTAHAAVSLLYQLRELTGQPIPVLVESRQLASMAAIEVYPAATLKARSTIHKGYKKRDSVSRTRRDEILTEIETDYDLDATARSVALENDDVLDAVVCVMAGFDYLDGICTPPEDRELAEREGWIWVRLPEAN